MTAKTAPPRLDDEIGKLKRRVDALERKLNDLLDVFKPEIVFSYSGALAVSESPTWTRREAGRLVEVHARLRGAGSTDTVVEVQKNAVTFLTVTIPAGQLWAQRMCAEFFSADSDVLHDVLTTPGTGAEDLTVAHRFKR